MSKRNTIKNKFTGKDYLKAKGIIPYGMMNDYIFRIVFQENKFALKGLLCSVLGLNEDQIVSLRITNEVKPGVSISDKEYRMDIVEELNDGVVLNLEMQKENYDNWQYRSLGYLCREFDTLDHGDDYSDVKKVYQIGFLNFDIFNDHPEFFAAYQMRNAKDGYLYTDRFNLFVISLNQIKLATKQDRANGLDTWARLFKSKTWEELIMVANDNKYMTSAVESVYLTNEDRNAIKIAREREDYLRHEAYQKRQIKTLKSDIKKLKNDMAETIAEKDFVIAEKDSIIAKLQAELDSLKNNN